MRRNPASPGAIGVGEPLDRRAFLARSTGALASLSAGATLLSACGGSSSPATVAGGSPPAHPTGLLHVGNSAAPTSLDPAQAALPGEFTLLRNIHDGLVNFDPTYTRLAPGLARSWAVSDDGLEWSFDLREDAHFHDGEPVDAAAVKRSLEWYMAADGTFGQLLVPGRDVVRAIDTPTASRVRIVLRSPYADFAANQTLVRIVSPRSIAAGARTMDDKPAGAGPFRVVSRGADGTVVLEAFPEYYGPGPHVERLEVPVVTNLTSRVSALSAGDLDMVFAVPPLQAEQLKATRGIALSSSDSWGLSYLAFRCDAAPFGDARVRKAVFHVLDRAQVVSGVLRGRGKVVDNVYPAGFPGYRPAQTTYAHDVEAARALLREAGVPTPLRFAFGGTPDDAQVNQALVGQLNDSGLFEVKLLTLEETVYSKQLDATSPRFSVFRNTNFWLTGGPLFFTIGLFPTLTHYRDARLDRLTAMLSATAAGPERDQVLADIQSIFEQQAFWMPLFQQQATDAFKDDVRGYNAPKDGFMPFLGGAYLAS